MQKILGKKTLQKSGSKFLLHFLKQQEELIILYWIPLREIADQKSQVSSLKLQQAGEGKLHFILACAVHASI
jgi:hypothetical protein